MAFTPRQRLSEADRLLFDQANVLGVLQVLKSCAATYRPDVVSELAILATTIQEQCQLAGIDPEALTEVLNLPAALYDAWALTQSWHNPVRALDYQDQANEALNRSADN
ncbi:hypothetical protein [uncultured Halomonas sp.]|uniref:hypothetical protein n=1 Tax=uncultured Halomonas sp. TaxID=173971 RepID=UPI00262A4154|nr:hypothetical protein [uncultured Halomonas sp.]